MTTPKKGMHDQIMYQYLGEFTLLRSLRRQRKSTSLSSMERSQCKPHHWNLVHCLEHFFKSVSMIDERILSLLMPKMRSCCVSMILAIGY